MKVKFYVLNCDSTLYNCFLTAKAGEDTSYILGKHQIAKVLEIPRLIFLNSYAFYIFLNELQCSPTFHRALACEIKKFQTPFVIQLTPNKFEFIDKTWGEIVRVLIWEQLEIDHMMSWLSTLGGAFSALGDYFEDRADIAGKISIQQMKLAMRLGDPGLISRCFLYSSIALIQKRRFKLAKRIIQAQFTFATLTNDHRLTKMCLGIYSKLQYTYKVTRQNRKAVKCQ